MSEQKKQNDTEASPILQKTKEVTNDSAIAMELPFTLVGAVVFGGLIGYFVDKWLHTSPWLMIVFGGLGFVAGIREVIRRLPAK